MGINSIYQQLKVIKNISDKKLRIYLLVIQLPKIINLKMN